jgi:hypothetical protein
VLTRSWQILLFWAGVTGLLPLVQAQTLPPAVPSVSRAEPAPEWNAKFDGKEGWIGGDGAYSVVLDGQRVLWLFGDTLLGTVKDGKRAGAAMVSNTVGVQTGQGKEAAIRFISGKSRDGKPAAIFLPPDGKGWFWPAAAVRVNGRLFVFLSQIDKGKDPGVLGFRHVGVWLARIDNPNDEPEKWRLKLQRVPFARFDQARVQCWGSAVLADGEDLYVYGYQEQGKEIGSRKLLVARVPAEKLADFAAWQFHTADGWSDRSEDATPLIGGLATEFSVSHLADGKGFVLVCTENGLGDRIVGRFARAAAGPWSAPVLLYRCPEMAGDRGVFCYAAKAHSWAAKDNELLISYCANTWEFARLFREEKVYRPKFVRVRLEPAN